MKMRKENLLDRVRTAKTEDLFRELNGDTELSDAAKARILELTLDFCEDRNLFRQIDLGYANPEVARIKYLAYLVVTNRFSLLDLYPVSESIEE